MRWTLHADISFLTCGTQRDIRRQSPSKFTSSILFASTTGEKTSVGTLEEPSITSSYIVQKAHFEEAKVAYIEAIERYRRLAQQNQDEDEPHLGQPLNDH